MISFDEAQALLLAGVEIVSAERVPLEDAEGRVAAEDVIAAAPMPAFDYSSMDGYAIATGDLAGGGPFRLPVRGESAAGGQPPTLAPGSACRIFTGAERPERADAVLPQEDVEREGDVITFARAPAPGAHLRRRGEDLAAGVAALARGARMTPGRVALVAGLDRAHLLVARRPIVTILGSGDELRAPGSAPRPGSIPESNGYFVAAAARAAGASTRIAPFVRDDRDEATRTVAAALRSTDVLVTIGGVSVGDHDVMRPALEAAGVSLAFHRVAMKPGKPLLFGRAGAAHVLGLPGNPASASLTFLLFGVPLLRALQGDRTPHPPRVRAEVQGSMRRKPGRVEFARARLDAGASPPRARLLPNQASGAVTSFAEADALVVIPAESDGLRDGDPVEVIRLSDV